MCVWNKKFQAYLFGHPLELVTDHKLLLGLLRENHLKPLLVSSVGRYFSHPMSILWCSETLRHVPMLTLSVGCHY